MKNPEIRFIDDNIDWEERKLGELNNLSIPTIYKNYYLEIGDIKPLSNSYTLDKTKKIVSGAKLATNGTILVSTVRPTRGAICKLKDGNIFVSSALYQFNSNNEFLNDIILQQLQTYKFLKYCGDNCEGGTYPTISKENIDKFIVKIPKNVEKISKTLTSIDVKITNQTAIIEKLYNTKSALLIKMFPQENQSVPELRFDGFTDTWEQCKFGELCSIVTKQTGFDYTSTIKKALLTESSNDTLPYLQTKNFAGTNINYNTDYFIPKSVAKEFPDINLDEKCLLFSIVGASVGNIGLFPGDKHCFLSGAICVSKQKNHDDTDYLYHYMCSEKGQDQIRICTKGGAQATITIEDIRELTVLMPHKQEKNKIGKLLSSLDNLITLHQRKPFHLNFSL